MHPAGGCPCFLRQVVSGSRHRQSFQGGGERRAKAFEVLFQEVELNEGGFMGGRDRFSSRLRKSEDYDVVTFLIGSR